MIRVEKHRLFKRYYQKLNVKQKRTFDKRIELFCKNPRDPFLRVHRLGGYLKGFYAFSIGGDLRVVFDWVDENQIVLYKIGTHNQVY